MHLQRTKAGVETQKLGSPHTHSHTPSSCRCQPKEDCAFAHTHTHTLWSSPRSVCREPPLPLCEPSPLTSSLPHPTWFPPSIPELEAPRAGTRCKHLVKSQDKQKITQRIPTGGSYGLLPSAVSSCILQASCLCPPTKSHQGQFKSIVLLTVYIQTPLEKGADSRGLFSPGPHLCCASRTGLVPMPQTPHPNP